MSRCKSCGAPVIWAHTAGGKKVPMDAERVPDGQFSLVSVSGGEWLAVYGAERDRDDGYQSHFASCPQADEHRRR